MGSTHTYTVHGCTHADDRARTKCPAKVCHGKKPCGMYTYTESRDQPLLYSEFIISEHLPGSIEKLQIVPGETRRSLKLNLPFFQLH